MAENRISLTLTNEVPVDQDYADQQRRRIDAEWAEYTSPVHPPDFTLSVGGRPEEAEPPAAGAGGPATQGFTPDPRGPELRKEALGKRDAAYASIDTLRTEREAAGMPAVPPGMPPAGGAAKPAPAPAAPSPAGAPAEPPPSVWRVTHDTWVKTAQQGRDAIVGALAKLAIPLEGETRDPLAAGRKALVEGAMPWAFAPVTALVAGAGQALENLTPEVANATLFQGGPGGPAFTARHLLMGAPDKRTIPNEQIQQMQEPMTVREGFEHVANLGAPLGAKPAARAAKKVATATQAQLPTLKGERGSMGFPPAGGAVPKPPVPGEPPVPQGMVRLYRGEGSRAGGPVWKDPEMNKLAGQWFTEDKAVATDFAGRADLVDRTGAVLYVDVPVEVAQKARGIHPTADPGVAPERGQHLLPPEWAAKAQRLAPGEAPPPAGAPPGAPPALPPGPPGAPPPGPGAPPPSGAAPGAGAGPHVGEARINVGRLNAEESVKQVAAAVNALQSEALAARRTPRRHTELIQKANDLGLTVERALDIDPDTVPFAEAEVYQQAFRDLNLAVDTRLEQLARAVQAGDPGARAQLVDTYLVGGHLSQKQEIFGNIFARGVESRRIGAEAARARGTFDPAEFATLRDRVGTAEGMDAETLASRILTVRRTSGHAGQQSWMRATVNALRLGLNAVNSIWINWSLLSNPVSHAANLVGTGVMHIYEMALERPVAGVVGEISRGYNIWRDRPPGDHVRLAETSAMWMSVGRGVLDGLRLSGMALKEPWRGIEVNPNLSPAAQQAARALLERTRIELKPFTAEAFGFDPNNQFGRIIDTLGTIGHRAAIPTQLLGAEDAINKGIAFTTELRALARREAMARGATGRARAVLEEQLVANPSPGMIQEAIDGAFLRTLNAELGSLGQKVLAIANETPGGRLVAPFIVTPTNSAKFVGQRTPVLNVISQQNRRDIAAGGVARDRALARIAVGTAVGIGVYYMVGNEMIIGQGPVDPRLRRDYFAAPKDERTPRRVPMSWLVGDTYFGLDRLDPVLGAMIGTMATAAEIIGQLPEGPPDSDEEDYNYSLQLFWATTTAASRVFVNKTYLRGLHDMMDSIFNPQSAGSRYATSIAASAVPSGLRQYTTRVADDGVMRDFRGLVSRIRAAVPGYSETVPPRVQRVTGDPVYYPPGVGPDMVSPVIYGLKAGDPVLDALVENKIVVPDWPKSLGGSAPDDAPITDPRRAPGVELTLDQRHRLATLTTQVVTLNGMTQYEYVKDLIQSDLYQKFEQTGPGTTRSTLLRGAFDVFLKLGVRELRKEDPDLDARLTSKAERDMEKRLPGPPRTPDRSRGMVNTYQPDSLRR